MYKKQRAQSVQPGKKSNSVKAMEAASNNIKSLNQMYQNIDNPSSTNHRTKTKAPNVSNKRNQSSHRIKRNPSVPQASQAKYNPNGAPYTNPFSKPKSAQTKNLSQPKSAQTKNLSQTNNNNLLQTNPHTEEGRKKIANDTLKIINDGKYYISKFKKTVYIKKDIDDSKKGTITYKPKYYDNIAIIKKKYSSICQFKVLPESSFGAAKYLVNHDKIKNTCVLNFASAIKPGGGFKNGRQAQEESLSRQSALYESIKESEMYKEHKKDLSDNYYTDYMIYSPNVPVFRNDQDESLLPPDEYFTVNIITSAAPNKAKIDKDKYSMTSSAVPNKSQTDLNKLILNRIRKIIKCAIDNNNDALVLGAYGCGVFGNDPKDISKIFKNVLITEGFGFYFKKVIFAITGPHSENFRAFKAEFP